MTKRKNGLTREQHQELGRELKQARNATGRAYIAVATAYNRSERRVARILRKLRAAQNAVDAVRSDLEAILANEHDDWETSDYYGGG